MKKALCSLFLAGGMLLALPVQAQFAKPEDAVRYRQSAMNIIGNHLGRIAGQLKSGNPDMKTIQASAMVVETLSKIQFEGFVAGTENVANTKAKPELFKDTAKVKQLIETAQAETAKLISAARSGDAKAVQTALGATGQACKSCHDDYRKQ